MIFKLFFILKDHPNTNLNCSTKSKYLLNIIYLGLPSHLGGQENKTVQSLIIYP